MNLNSPINLIILIINYPGHGGGWGAASVEAFGWHFQIRRIFTMEDREVGSLWQSGWYYRMDHDECLLEASFFIPEEATLLHEGDICDAISKIIVAIESCRQNSHAAYCCNKSVTDRFQDCLKMREISALSTAVDCYFGFHFTALQNSNSQGRQWPSSANRRGRSNHASDNTGWNSNSNQSSSYHGNH